MWKYIDKLLARHPKEQIKGLKLKLKVSKKLTAILDLDHTLIFSSLKKIENKKDYIIIQNKYYVYKRPDLDRFLYTVCTLLIISCLSIVMLLFILPQQKNMLIAL